MHVARCIHNISIYRYENDSVTTTLLSMSVICWDCLYDTTNNVEEVDMQAKGYTCNEVYIIVLTFCLFSIMDSYLDLHGYPGIQ